MNNVCMTQSEMNEAKVILLRAVQDMSPVSSVLGIELHLHRVYTIDINVQQLGPVQSSESR